MATAASFPVSITRTEIVRLASVVTLACILDLFLDHSLVYWALLGAAVWIVLSEQKKQRTDSLEKQREEITSHWQLQKLLEQSLTARESSEWVTKFVARLWPNVLQPHVLFYLRHQLKSTLLTRKPTGVVKVDVEEFTLGSSPPEVGLGLTHWYTDVHGQDVLLTGVRWRSKGLSIQLAFYMRGSGSSPLRVQVSGLQADGQLQIRPVLGGEALLYAFETVPVVNLQMSILPGQSKLAEGLQDWLSQVLKESLSLTTTMPGYGIVPLSPLWPSPLLQDPLPVIGCQLEVTLVAGGDLARNASSGISGSALVELTLGEVKRLFPNSRRRGSTALFGSTENMVTFWDQNVPGNGSRGGAADVLQFDVMEDRENGGGCDFLGNCAVKFCHGLNGSAFFWSIGSDGEVIVGKSQGAGHSVALTVPLANGTKKQGYITLSLVVTEWIRGSQSMDSLNSLNEESFPLVNLQPPLSPLTGRSLLVTVREMQALSLRPQERAKASKLYIRLTYGKNSFRTRGTPYDPNPVFGDTLRFLEVSGASYVTVSLVSQSGNVMMGRHTVLGSAKVSLKGLRDSGTRSLSLPLAGVSSGTVFVSLHLSSAQNGSGEAAQEETTAPEPLPGTYVAVEVLEARELSGGDPHRQLDPYVSIRCGSLKKKTKVVRHSSSPQWNEVLEFPLSAGGGGKAVFKDHGTYAQEDCSMLLIHVKDHHTLIANAWIGHAELALSDLPLNEAVDRWVPLKELGGGEIHLKVTKRIGVPGAPVVPKRAPSVKSTSAATTLDKLTATSQKLRYLVRTALSVAEEAEDPEDVRAMIGEVSRAEDEREALIAQLESDKDLLVRKVKQFEKAFAASQQRQH